MSSQTIQKDITVVGGGMVGLAAANILARETEYSIALVDAGSATLSTIDVNKENAWDPRVVALTPKSIELLKRCDAWEEISSLRACPYSRMYVWDAEGTANVEFNADDIHSEALGYIVENSVVVNALRKALMRTNSVDIYEYTEVQSFNSDTQFSLGCRDKEGAAFSFTSSLVIAADGALSSLRNLAEIETREWDYQHSAIVTTVALEKSHQFCAWQRFSSAGPLAFLPLSHDGEKSNVASIVWSIESDKADSLMDLEKSEFDAALSREFEYLFGNVKSMDKLHCIPLRQRHAKAYIRPGLALVGDAAHTIHPLAGQGVNLGLYDVDVLCEEIARAQTRKFPVSDSSVLKRYQRRRQNHNLAAMASMEFFKRLFASDALVIRWARNEGMRITNKLPLLKKVLSNMAAGKIANG